MISISILFSQSLLQFFNSVLVVDDVSLLGFELFLDSMLLLLYSTVASFFLSLPLFFDILFSIIEFIQSVQ